MVHPQRGAPQRLKSVFPRLLTGSLLGLVVGLTPPLTKLFMTKNGLLSPLFEAMRTLGTAYVPAVVLVLAGSLFPGKADGKAEVKESGGKKIFGQDVSFVKQILFHLR